MDIEEVKEVEVLNVDTTISEEAPVVEVVSEEVLSEEVSSDAPCCEA